MSIQYVCSVLIATLCCLILSNCSINHTHARDPYHQYNRAVFAFNQAVKAPWSDAKCKPEKKPHFLLTGTRNFLANLDEPMSMLNSLLQLKGIRFFEHFMRLTINTTLGVGGLFDIATPMGLDMPPNTFSLTLAYYSNGMPADYVVVPFIGPRTTHQVAAMPVDRLLTPFFYLSLGPASLAMIPLKIISRPRRISAACAAGIDPYIHVKNEHLKSQQQKIDHVLAN